MTLGEPILCEVLENPRSSNVRLRFSKNGVLTVVVPYGFSKSRILEILETKREWIRKHWALLKRVSFESSVAGPERIDLAAFGESWEVHFTQNDRGAGGLCEDKEGRRLLARGARQDGETLGRLRQWLVKRCRAGFGPWLDGLSRAHGLPYRKMAVRIQKSRWGSCSAKKTISLNAKLAFLPANLVEYVFCHELCHTLHLNHSRAFWECLERILPGSLTMRKALRGCEPLVPGWLEAPKSPSETPPGGNLTFYLQ